MDDFFLDAQVSSSIPRNVRWEVSRLKSITAISTESVRPFLLKDGSIDITFDIKTDILIEPTATQINNEESIRLKYSSPKAVTIEAPIVFSSRNDFPRDLPHINPGPATEDVSLCLARTGHQALYDSSGIYGIIERLASWLNEAKTGKLYDEGWVRCPYFARHLGTSIFSVAQNR